MATRNERKRAAKAKREALEQAVNEAFALEAKRKAERDAIAPRLSFYEALPKSSNGKLVERRGAVVKGKFAPKQATPFEPLVHDGNESGYGQLRRRWI